MPEPIHIFATGSQDAAWQARNCAQCRQRTTDAAGWTTSTCALDEALLVAYWTDGTVPAAIAQRLGYPGPGVAYTWDCPEREPVPVRRDDAHEREGD